MKRSVCLIALLLVAALCLATSSVFAADISPHAPDFDDPQRQAEVDAVNTQIDEFMNNAVVPYSNSSNGLSVPVYQQANSYYCGPASVQMVVKYITGVYIQQSTLASSMGTASNGGTYVYRVAQELNSRCGSGTYQYVHTSEASFSDSLIYSINKGRPIIAHVMTGGLPNYNYQSNSGHYIVVRAYSVSFSGTSSSTTCQYNDPHYNSKYYGTYTCTMSQMLSAINANAGYFIRST